MGAWIEISWCNRYLFLALVAPHDGCVDWNPVSIRTSNRIYGRTPRWVRGLKFNLKADIDFKAVSHPTMGAWIEIVLPKMLDGIQAFTMGAWIEILLFPLVKDGIMVAPHDGCVDWNSFIEFLTCFWRVSHPTMGAWIEIDLYNEFVERFFCRTPRWVRGLKYLCL